MNDRERQEDELEVLQSIYPHELIVTSKWPLCGCLKISPSIMSEQLDVIITTVVNKQSSQNVLKVEHLAPIELYFHCPENYPSTSQPNLMIHCIWLKESEMSAICSKLDNLWDTYESEILFTWASFLKEDCCSYLSLNRLEFTVDIDNIKSNNNHQNNNNGGNDKHSLCLNVQKDGNRSEKKPASELIYESYGGAKKTLNVKPLLNELLQPTNETTPSAAAAAAANANARVRRKKKATHYDRYKYETPKDLEKKEELSRMRTNEEREQLRTVMEKLPGVTAENTCSDSNTVTEQSHIFRIISVRGKRKNTTTAAAAAAMAMAMAREIDSRVICNSNVTESRNAINVLEKYNEQVLETEFRSGVHTCEVCYETKAGTHCVRLKRCAHVFCKDCVRDYLTLNICNCNVLELRCMQFDCQTSFTDVHIEQNVDPDVYQKYRKFRLKLAVETDPNLLYCPREICQSVASICALGEDMCHCGSCDFYFCMYCKKAYHGVENCDLQNEERLKVIREYQEASTERKLELEKRFSKQRLSKWVQDDLTRQWIEKCSKPCPNCRAIIQKSDGCNKMVCSNCNTPFCWLCNAFLNRSQPYKHFNDPESSCYQLLFPAEELIEDNLHAAIPEEGDEDDDDADDFDDAVFYQFMNDVFLEFIF